MKIGDLGLSQPANSTSLDNEIYGIIPYITPEILKLLLSKVSDVFPFSKASDIYSMGMIMWELTTGCKPFANVEHEHSLVYKIIDEKRPEITNDTPEDFANLMKKCWNSDPKKRPSAIRVHDIINYWLTEDNDVNIFNQAEEIRLELIKSKMLGPEFCEKSHSKAIYTSRSLSFLISKSSSSNSPSFNMRQKYITKEYEFDINDINDISNIQSESSEKWKIEDETQDDSNNRKHVKTDTNINTENKE
ncbi:kinase-like domain-containing protein [Glomus cerebriforme]|uniref:Kinase-like domain-containing protein n=1 Tax=Glomus cerebriforme TaxID=658196 RepID=A0A397SUR3_9GLOM|nr:kinase-like domain-containing protein [Glomus cerebriforme]